METEERKRACHTIGDSFPSVLAENQTQSATLAINSQARRRNKEGGTSILRGERCGGRCLKKQMAASSVVHRSDPAEQNCSVLTLTECMDLRDGQRVRTTSKTRETEKGKKAVIHYGYFSILAFMHALPSNPWSFPRKTAYSTRYAIKTEWIPIKFCHSTCKRGRKGYKGWGR